MDDAGLGLMILLIFWYPTHLICFALDLLQCFSGNYEDPISKEIYYLKMRKNAKMKKDTTLSDISMEVERLWWTDNCFILYTMNDFTLLRAIFIIVKVIKMWNYKFESIKCLHLKL